MKPKCPFKGKEIVMKKVLTLILLYVVLLIGCGALYLCFHSVVLLGSTPDAEYSQSLLGPWDSKDQVTVCAYDDSVYYISREGGTHVVRRATKTGNRVVCRLGETYGDSTLGVIDHDTLILHRPNDTYERGQLPYGDLVMYSVKDKTDKTIGRVNFVSYTDGKIYCYSQTDTDEMFIYDYILYEYSVPTGEFSELHRFTGSIASQDANGIAYEAEERIHYYSLSDKELKPLFAEIPWTNAQKAQDASCNCYSWFSHYIVRTTDDTLEVYDVETGEVKTLLPAEGTRLIYACITEEAVYFSNWKVDIAFWPLKDDKNGFYKYTFATGETKKISNGKYYAVSVYDDRSAIVETMMGKIKRIRLPE